MDEIDDFIKQFDKNIELMAKHILCNAVKATFGDYLSETLSIVRSKSFVINSKIFDEMLVIVNNHLNFSLNNYDDVINILFRHAAKNKFLDNHFLLYYFDNLNLCRDVIYVDNKLNFTFSFMNELFNDYHIELITLLEYAFESSNPEERAQIIRNQIATNFTVDFIKKIINNNISLHAIYEIMRIKKFSYCDVQTIILNCNSGKYYNTIINACAYFSEQQRDSLTTIIKLHNVKS